MATKNLSQLYAKIDAMSAELRELKKAVNGAEKFLTPIETAKLLKVSMPTLRAITKEGKIKGHTIKGRSVRYILSEITISVKKLK